MPPQREVLFLAESFDIRPPHLWDVVTTKGFVGMTVSGYTNRIAVANGYGTICGREDPCSFWTWGTAQAFKGPFTVAWWMLDPGVAYEDNPPVLGNRNNHDDVLEESGRPAPGFTVFLKSQTPPGEKGITSALRGVLMRHGSGRVRLRRPKSMRFSRLAVKGRSRCVRDPLPFAPSGAWKSNAGSRPAACPNPSAIAFRPSSHFRNYERRAYSATA